MKRQVKALELLTKDQLKICQNRCGWDNYKDFFFFFKEGASIYFALQKFLSPQSTLKKDIGKITKYIMDMI